MCSSIPKIKEEHNRKMKREIIPGTAKEKEEIERKRYAVPGLIH